MHRRLRRALLSLALLVPAHAASAQDLGFATGIFSRVHRLSLFVNALEPKDAREFDRSGRGCITLSLCGAGVRVMIDLDTRTQWMDLELGLGAGYLRALRGNPGDTIEIRGALRSLPVISTQATFLLNRYASPYFAGSFGLVDIWNGRAHNSQGRQSELRASTFEYGISGGVVVRPPNTNGRLLLEAGYRARTFASVGYTTTDPLGPAWPRQIDMSGWQVSAGWQFDLRPIAKSPDNAGTWALARVDAAAVPLVLQQTRVSDGVNVRRELMNGWLELYGRPNSYRLVLITRETTLNTGGVAQEIRYPAPTEERGAWTTLRSGAVVFTRAGGGEVTAERIEDELVLVHAGTGRRLHFRKVKSGG
jgi:hypothetical protein